MEKQRVFEAESADNAREITEVAQLESQIAELQTEVDDNRQMCEQKQERINAAILAAELVDS